MRFWETLKVGLFLKDLLLNKDVGVREGGVRDDSKVSDLSKQGDDVLMS